MSRRSRRNRHQNQGTALVKASRLPEGTVAVDAAALVRALTQQPIAAQVEPLPRPEGWDTIPFAPGMPLVPRPINALRPDSGRPEPRRFDYPVSANLPGDVMRLVPWKVLRDAADQIDMVRRCVEVVKSTILGFGWDITVSDEAVEVQRRTKGQEASDSEVSADLFDELSDEIDRLKSWWKVPDRGNGLRFKPWLTSLLEEHLVLDAVAIYPRLTLGGELFSLECLDGSTIKPLLDERGNTPLPPAPAYQQVLLGFPRGEFTADAVVSPEGDYLIDSAYLSSQLVYERRNVRTWTPYGYSPVEQALASADMWLKRQAWMRAEYTDGVMPAGWLLSDGNFTPQQLREYATVLNDYLSGMTQERHRFQILPKGITPAPEKDASERYRPHYDEFLLKLVCSHFGVLPSQIGFAPQSGLGGKGHQEGEEDSQERQGVMPVVEWVNELITSLSRQYLGMDDRLEFRLLPMDADDEAAADKAEDDQFKSGRLTLNETRDAKGKPRYKFPEADTPMLVTQSGVIFLEGEQQRQADSADSTTLMNQARAQAFGVAPAPTGPQGSQVPPGSTGDGPNGAGGGSGKGGPGSSPQKADELAALRRWQKRVGKNPAREFVCKHLTASDIGWIEKRAGLTVNLNGVRLADEGGQVVETDPDGGSAPGHGAAVDGLHQSRAVWSDPPPDAGC